jgi:hypothetical protein
VAGGDMLAPLGLRVSAAGHAYAQASMGDSPPVNTSREI